MKKIRKIFFISIICICYLIILTFNIFSYDKQKLIPIADIVYIKANLVYPIISNVSFENNNKLKLDDIVKSIKLISTAEELNIKEINKFYSKDENEQLLVRILRNGNEMEKELTIKEFKKYTLDFSIGVIGTITGIDEDGNYIGLGHDLKLNNSNLILEESVIYKTGCITQEKSYKGNVGCLITKDIGEELGILNNVNKFRIKGFYKNFNYDNNKAMHIDKPKVGDAYIYCKTPGSNELKMHKIKITKVYSDISNIEVLDKQLIKFRGGLVQGMSGSPIIQNNKIVGGLRGIKISNPRIGYISNIDKMLD